MPIRGYKEANPNEWVRLNELLENAFKAEKDHRFVKLHQQKPIEDEWSRIFEYVPGVDSQLGLDALFQQPTMVVHMGLLRQPMQFGKSVVLNGGVRDVATLRSVQGKGIGLLVALDAIKFMFENEVDFSILFSGAGPFYEKSGWRGGFNHINYHLTRDQIISIIESDGNQKDQYSARVLENSESDLGMIADLYSSTNLGLYFTAHRDKEYWKRHFETNPQIIWEYIGVFNTEGRLVAYFRYIIKQNKEKVDVYITECRVSFNILPGSLEFDAILFTFIKFLEEEAIDSINSLNEIHLDISPQHTIIHHLIKSFPDLMQGLAFKPNHMVLITNPYSLFRKINEELTDRIDKNIKEIESSSDVSILFDKSSKYPGGLIIRKIQNLEKTFSFEIYNKNEEFKANSVDINDRIEFDSISALTMFFCNFIPLEDWNDEDLLEEMGVKCYGLGKSWLKILFGGSDCAMYELDHY